MIAHTFICRGDEWILEHHLSVYSRIADKIVVILDRSPQNEATCRKYGAEVIHWQSRVDYVDFNETGLLCDEGEMRQAGLEACLKYRPDFIVFGDTDEAPTPDIIEFIASNPDSSVDLFLCDWVNLVHSVRTAIGGESRWSFQTPRGNKKDLVLRVRNGIKYNYPAVLQHVRMDRSGLETRIVPQPKLIHYKYAAWEKWCANPQSKTNAYADLLAKAEIVPVPSEWLWPFPIPLLDNDT